MDPVFEIPYCPLPPESVSDVVPMVVVLGVFLFAGWLVRRWKGKRGGKKGRE